MPKYYFDTYYGSELTADTVGIDCDDPQSLRREAMRALPAIASDKIRNDGDQQAFTVLVRDESGITVYTATLVFSALWLGGGALTRDGAPA